MHRLGILASSALSLSYATALGQVDTTFDPTVLMDAMVGEWVMTGTIAGDSVVHDVSAEWILQRRYVRLHEVSRERTAAGELAYEAFVHIAWDSAAAEYVVMWLDDTATTNFAEEGVGRGVPRGNTIPFVWSPGGGSGIRNTFTYDATAGTWSWAIENVIENGESIAFADLRLEPK